MIHVVSALQISAIFLDFFILACNKPILNINSDECSFVCQLPQSGVKKDKSEEILTHFGTRIQFKKRLFVLFTSNLTSLLSKCFTSFLSRVEDGMTERRSGYDTEAANWITVGDAKLK